MGVVVPELVVSLAYVLVQRSHVVPVSVEEFVGGGVLQHAGNGAQDVSLLWLQGGACRPVHHVETVGSHDGGVHVAVVDQVTYNLGGRRHNADSHLRNRYNLP